MTVTRDNTNSHPALTGVALIDAQKCAAAGDMSVSWWHCEVAAGRAPAPAVRQPRCTRWRLKDVEAFWLAFVSRAQADAQTAEQVTAQAKKASLAARAKRTASIARVPA